MKANTRIFTYSLFYFAAGLCLLAVLLANRAEAAASQYWDNNETSAAGNGTWDNSSANWANSSALTASTVAFTNGNFALFSAGTANIGNLTITVNSAVSCAGLGTGTSSGAGNVATNLTFSGTGSIGLTNGTQNIDCDNANAGITFNVALTGPGGFSQHGGGFIALAQNNSYAGGTTLTGGQVIYYYTNASFGVGPITNGGSPGGAIVNNVSAALTITNNVYWASGNNNALNLAGGNPVGGLPGTTFSGNFALNSGNTILYGSSTATEVTEISGVISGTGATPLLEDPGTLEFGGANTYSGNTGIGNPAVLSIVGSGALGAGAYSGNITNGFNVPNGAITNGTKFIYASSTPQTLSGVISGGGVLILSNNASLSLSGNNIYTNSTIIESGTLNVSADGASSGNSGNLGVVPASVAAANITLAGGTLNANGSFALNANRGITMTASSSLSVANGATLSYGGVIAGAFNLTKAGPGILVLSANHSTYSGLTIINAGTIQTGGDAGAGGVGNLGKVPASFVAANITLGGGSLVGNNVNFGFSPNRGITLSASSGLGSLAGDTTAFPQVITGGGNLAINGGAGNTGTVQLSANNTYTGATTLSAGKLIVIAGGSCSNSAVEVQTGGNTLSDTITNNGLQWTCAALAFDDSTGTLDFNFGSLVSPSASMAPLNVLGAITFTGTPTVTVETGSLPPGPGMYPLVTWTSVSGTVPTSVSLPPRATGSLMVVGNTLYLNITANADPLEWAISGIGTWDINLTENWDDSTGAGAFYMQPVIPGDAVVFDDTYISAATTVTLNSTVSPVSVAANNSAYDYTITGTGAIAGGAGLLKQGAAALVLACTNTFTGGTIVNAGKLQLGDGVANNGVVVGAIQDNATLVFANPNTQTNTSTITGPGSVTTMGPALLGLGGSYTYGGPTTNTANLVISGSATLGGGVYAANIVNSGTFTYNSSSAQNLAGVISGSGALIQNGPGVLALSGVNTFTGPVTNGAGTLLITAGGLLGAGNYASAISSSATVNFSNAAPQTLSGVVSGAGTLVASGAGALTLSGANTYTGGTLITNATVNVNAIADSGPSAIGPSGTVTLGGGTLTYTGLSPAATTRQFSGVSASTNTINSASPMNLTGRFTAAVSGAFYVNYNGPGALTLGNIADNSSLGINVNNGSTVVLNTASASAIHGLGAASTVGNGGTLQLSGTGIYDIYTGAPVTVKSGGVLDVNGRSDSFSALNLSGSGIGGSGALMNSSPSTTSYLTNSGGVVLAGNTVIGGAGNLWLQMAVSGAGFSLNYAGGGDLTLAGTNNTYTGNTIISSGTLSLRSTISSQGIVIAGGATLDLTPLAPTTITLTSQTVSNSSSPAIINGNLNSGTAIASLTYAAGTPSFTIQNGVLTLTNLTIFKINNTGATLAPGNYNIIAAGSGGSVVVHGALPAVTVNGGGIIAGATPSLATNAGGLYLVVPYSPPVIARIVTNYVVFGSAWQIAISSLQTAAGWSDPEGNPVTLSGAGPMSANSVSVTTDGTNIYYAGPLTAQDSFSYTITDGVATTDGTVYLEPLAITSVGLTSSESPSGFKDSISFTGTLPSGATGNVMFQTNSVLFDTEALSNGVATSTAIAALPRGTNLITAIYSGDMSFAPSTNMLSQVVTNHPPVAAVLTVTRAPGVSLLVALSNIATNLSDADGDPVELTGINLLTTNGVTITPLNLTTNADGSYVTTNLNAYLGYINNLNVADQFSYSISDGVGGTNIGYVNILIGQSVPSPNISSPTSTGNGNPTFVSYGIPGYVYGVESETNILGPWIEAGTITAVSNGILNFTDLSQTNPPVIFYRIYYPDNPANPPQ